MTLPPTTGEGPETDARYGGPIADDTSRHTDYGERNADPPEHMACVPWAVFQAFDPARHSVEDRWRVATALRDVPKYIDTPRQRAQLVAHAREVLDAAASLRRASERPEGPTFVLAILGLPADYFAQVEAEEVAFRAKPQKPCSCGWGSPGHVPLLRRIDESRAASDEPEPPPEPGYLERMNDPTRSPLERALALAVVRKPARYSDEDFDLALWAVSAVLPPPDLAEDAVEVFALAWIEGARRMPEDVMGNIWPEVTALAGLVAKGSHPGARAFAERLLEHLFATHYTYAFTVEDLRDGKMPKLREAADAPTLIAAARAERPEAPASDWVRVGDALVKCVGAPTVADVVDLIDGYARSAERRSWQESMARSVRSFEGMPVTPRRVPGRCERILFRWVDGESHQELCPNPATITRHGWLGDSHVCAECIERERKCVERSEGAVARMQTERAARRAGIPGVKPTPLRTIAELLEAAKPKRRKQA